MGLLVIGDKRTLGNHYIYMSKAYSDLNEIDLSESYARKSLKIFESLNNEINISKAKNNLDEILQKKSFK